MADLLVASETTLTAKGGRAFGVDDSSVLSGCTSSYSR